MLPHGSGIGYLDARVPSALGPDALVPDTWLESAPIGMGLVGSDGTLIAMNAEFARLVAVQVEDALGRTLDTIAPSTHDRWREIVGAARDTPGLTRRVLTVSVMADRRSLEVVGWASPRGAIPLVSLLVSEISHDRGTQSLFDALERARVAREIHDGLAQDLWLAKLTASKLARHPTLDAEGQAFCTELLRSIDACLSEARTAVTAMRSVSEPTPPMSELIERQVNEFSDRFGIRAECHLEEGPPVPPRVLVEMLRVVQEALNNVRKHAAARRVVVRIAQRRTAMILSVRDDGIGFDPTTVSKGYGRQSMRERAQSIGARLTTKSAPGHGTTVTLRIPVAQLGAQA